MESQILTYLVFGIVVAIAVISSVVAIFIKILRAMRGGYYGGYGHNPYGYMPPAPAGGAPPEPKQSGFGGLLLLFILTAILLFLVFGPPSPAKLGQVQKVLMPQLSAATLDVPEVDAVEEASTSSVHAKGKALSGDDLSMFGKEPTHTVNRAFNKPTIVASTSEKDNYALQVGAYMNYDKAIKLRNELRATGMAVSIKKGSKGIHHVLLRSGFQTRDEVVTFRKNAKNSRIRKGVVFMLTY
jgi:hypothetical protein